MRTKEFVMRGKTASGGTEVLNFSGFKPGYAYRLIEFQIYPSDNIGGGNFELIATITAGKTAVLPTDPDFSNEALIASALRFLGNSPGNASQGVTVINDTFLITQNLILMVQDRDSGNTAVNWQCKFMPVKMSGSEEAVANYKQFMISDGS